MAKIPRTNNKILHTRIHPHTPTHDHTVHGKVFLCSKKHIIAYCGHAAHKKQGPPILSSYRQSVFCHGHGRFPVGKMCSAMSRVNFWSAECVLPHPRSISDWHSVFRHVLGQFPFGRVCFSTSWVNLRSAEHVPQRLGSISDRQSVFRHVLGRFPVVRV